MKIRILLLFWASFILTPYLYPASDIEVKKKVETIYQQKKFQYDTGTLKNQKKAELPPIIKKILLLLQKAADWIKDVLLKLKRTSVILFYLITALIIAAIVLMLILIVRKVSFISAGSKMPPVIPDKSEGHYDYELDLMNARKFLENGHYKEAVSLLLNALWLFLNRQGYVRYRKSMTNREYLTVLINYEKYSMISRLVFTAETAVYFEEKIDENQCREIFHSAQEIMG